MANEKDVEIAREIFNRQENRDEQVTLLTYLATRDTDESCLNGARHVPGYPSCVECIFNANDHQGERLCGGTTKRRQNLQEIARIILEGNTPVEVKEL